jgi:hypothetical protein
MDTARQALTLLVGPGLSPAIELERRGPHVLTVVHFVAFKKSDYVPDALAIYCA